jgi:hypothetical protein
MTLKLRPTWVILVGSELQKNKEASRAVQMAAIEGYAELLRNSGQGVHMQLLLLVLLPSLLHVFPTQTQVTLKYLDKTQMKDIRTKSAEFIHEQHIKGDNISSKFVFDAANAGVSDIAPGRYYGGLTYVRFWVVETAHELVHEG